MSESEPVLNRRTSIQNSTLTVLNVSTQLSRSEAIKQQDRFRGSRVSVSCTYRLAMKAFAFILAVLLIPAVAQGASKKRTHRVAGMPGPLCDPATNSVHGCRLLASAA
jgi:hypothetical protein